MRRSFGGNEESHRYTVSRDGILARRRQQLVGVVDAEGAAGDVGHQQIGMSQHTGGAGHLGVFDERPDDGRTDLFAADAERFDPVQPQCRPLR